VSAVVHSAAVVAAPQPRFEHVDVASRHDDVHFGLSGVVECSQFP
jgi:hypothetical protein